MARRARRIGPALQGCSCILLGFGLVVGLAAILLGLRLSAGPLSFPALSPRVAQAIAGQIGPGWDVSLRETALEIQEGSLALHAAGLEIRNPEGALVLRAPQAVVGVDALSLLLARLKPRAIEFRDLQLRAAINPDGSLSFGATGDVQPASATPDGVAFNPAPENALAPDSNRPSRISVAAASLFDLVLEPSGVIGSLSRARLRNARLTLVDAQQRERATFHKVDASFEHAGSGLRRFTMELEGPVGSWSVGGEVREAGETRNAVITASQMPVDDVLLLAGAPKLPGRTDLKLSARVEAALAAGRVTKLDTQVETAGGGTLWIHDKDVTPIPVETAAADASWNESRRELSLRKISFRGAGADVELGGALALQPGDEWKLSLKGQNARLAGVSAGDRAITLTSIEAKLSGHDGMIALDSLRLQGPDTDGIIAASFVTAGDRPGLQVKVQAGATGARTALRLWPEPAAPAVRRYLVANLRDGLLERLNVDLALSSDELAQAFRGGPIPGSSLKVDFALGGAELFVAEGLPTLSRGDVSGEVTGQRASVRSPGASIELAEGRALAFSEATFLLKDYWAKADPAQLSFQLSGGADALAALLQAPPLRSVAGLDFDASTVRGRAELRVQLALPIKDMPSLAELPVTVSGSLSEFGIEKLFGRDKLENGALALSYESGALQVRGEGKLGGSPATIDVRQPRGGVGEASIVVLLDEAARAR
ncbi:MAG TPA: DUF3971 domain-containing protein, partial [Allosphingosinicella sp.]|nr:DUF3971 domain-containing protein [Allosphingosinicella sp.]